MTDKYRVIHPGRIATPSGPDLCGDDAVVAKLNELHDTVERVKETIASALSKLWAKQDEESGIEHDPDYKDTFHLGGARSFIERALSESDPS